MWLSCFRKDWYGNLYPCSPRVRHSTCRIGVQSVQLELESFYSITTFIRAITSLLQIRQVAHLMEHYMQPARIKLHAKEHTNNPVQRPNFRGHAAGDGEVTRVGVGVGVLLLNHHLQVTRACGKVLELECTYPGSPRGQPGAREQEN